MAAKVYEAPQDEAETAIARIWQELLGVERVGRHDDFFALGGHSLKVIASLARVAGVFGKQIAQLDFYRQPTVAGVAALLARDTDAAHALVPLIARGAAPTRLTVVCAPYAGASATVFRPFADALCSRDPTLAVRAIALPGNELGSDARDYVSVEQIAQACADELVATNTGEIAVYGHCVGSFLAFELVRQLERRGRKVALLTVAAAFPLPGWLRMLPMPAPFRFTSDAKLHAMIRSWGAPTDDVDAEVVAFMMGNFRRDARLTFEYEKRRGAGKIAAPLLCIVSGDDSLTRGYALRFRAWSGWRTGPRWKSCRKGSTISSARGPNGSRRSSASIWTHMQRRAGRRKPPCRWPRARGVEPRMNRSAILIVMKSLQAGIRFVRSET